MPRTDRLALLLVAAWSVACGSRAQSWSLVLRGASRAIVTSDEGVLLTGSLYEPDTILASEAQFVRLRPDGRIAWSSYVSSGQLFESVGVGSACELATGDFLAVGSRDSAGDLLVGLSGAGTVRWIRSAAGGEDLRTLRVAPDGGAFLASLYYPGDMAASSITADGEVTWHRRWRAFESPIFSRVAVTVAGDGGPVLLAGGLTTDALPRSAQAIVVKLSPTGELDWAFEIGRPVDLSERPGAVTTLADGRFVLVGDVSAGAEQRKGWVVVLDADGVPIREQTIETGGDLVFDDVTALSDGNLLLSGTKLIGPPFVRTIVLTKTTTDGELLWSRELRRTDTNFLGSVTELSDSGLLLHGGDIAARLDADGRIDSPCLDVTDIDLTTGTLAPETVAITPRVTSPPFELLPTELQTPSRDNEALCSDVGGCPLLFCSEILVTPPEPCPGETVELELVHSGGEAPVTVEWDLDGDGLTDAEGDTALLTAPEAGVTVSATATDSCASPASCATELTFPARMPAAELSDVPAGGPPLLVRKIGTTWELRVEEAPLADAYHVYAGRFGEWYAAEPSLGAACVFVNAWPVAPAHVVLLDALPSGSQWIVVTAADGCRETAAGFDSLGRAREDGAGWTACGPVP